MDPYHTHYSSQPPPHPLAATYYPSQHSYPGIAPYSAPPYSTISSERKCKMKTRKKKLNKENCIKQPLSDVDMVMPHYQQQMYMTPLQIHPQLMGGGAHYYAEETSLWSR